MEEESEEREGEREGEGGREREREGERERGREGDIIDTHFHTNHLLNLQSTLCATIHRLSAQFVDCF